MTLVHIPWQQGYYLTPDTLELLSEASSRLMTKLIVSDAWRSYDEQAYYYDQYLHHGGNPAANPDTGQRNHMRGAAFDLVRTDSQVQAACRAVGLIRDAVEPWHWNNPNWQNMPIIRANDATTTVTTVTAAPLPQLNKKGKTVNFWRDTNGTIFYGAYPIPNMQRYQLLVRYNNSTIDKQDTFNAAERDMIMEALRANGMK